LNWLRCAFPLHRRELGRERISRSRGCRDRSRVQWVDRVLEGISTGLIVGWENKRKCGGNMMIGQQRGNEDFMVKRGKEWNATLKGNYV
jgi:hypothetical protein